MNALTSFTSDDCFAARYGAPLPRALHEKAGDMNWATFTSTFCRTSGPLKLGSWSAAPSRGGRTTFDATFGITPDQQHPPYIHTATATSFGPIDALTSMLYDAGFHIEIMSFHQQMITTGDASDIATFVLCEYDGRLEWSMAVGGTGAESSIRAIIGAANMLHG